MLGTPCTISSVKGCWSVFLTDILFGLPFVLLLLAIEAATRAALLRNELAQSKKEQAEYLRQVERAKNYEKSQEKKRARDERKGDAIVKEGDKPSKKVKKERHFEQKTVVTPKGQGVIDAKLGSVLDSLF